MTQYRVLNPRKVRDFHIHFPRTAAIASELRRTGREPDFDKEMVSVPEGETVKLPVHVNTSWLLERGYVEKVEDRDGEV